MEGYKVMIKLISPRFTISQWSLIEAWYDWNMAVEVLEFWMVESCKFFLGGVKEKRFYTTYLYNMNRFHDNRIFKIVEKYLTLLFKCHFRASFYNCCIMFLPKVCDTEILHRSNETCGDWKIMCHSNRPCTFMYQELACGVSCETMQGRDIWRCFTHSKTAFDELI